MRGLSIKQEKFCLEYVRCGNGTEAARLAGYRGSNTVLGAVSCENLKKPNITARIAELKKQIASEAIADATERKEFLTRVLRGEVHDTIIDSDGMAIDVPAKIADRIKASDQLNKMDGEYTQKVEVGGIDGGPLQFGWTGGGRE